MLLGGTDSVVLHMQAYYRFQRTDCGGGGTAPGERGGGSGGNELRRLLWLQRQRRRGGSWGASSTGGPEAALTAQQARQAQPPLMLVPGLGATMASWGADVLAELSCHREVRPALLWLCCGARHA